MAITHLEILRIVELSLFAPTLFTCLFVVRKHQAGKVAPWKFLSFAVLLKVIGASVGIAAGHVESGSILPASNVLVSLTLPLLLAAATALLWRVNEGMWTKGIPAKLIKCLCIPLLVAFIINIHGEIRTFVNSAGERSAGYILLKAVSIHFLVVLTGLIAITVHNVAKISHVKHSDRLLLLSVAASIPMLTVQVVYKVVCSFTEDSRWFSTHSTFVGAVALQGVMGSMPELITAVIYTVAGLKTPVALPHVEAQQAKEPTSRASEGDEMPPPPYHAVGKA